MSAETPVDLAAVQATETSHWEYVYGPTDEWHLTCFRCARPIYRDQEALITEDAAGDYVRAVCCVPRT